MKKNENQKLSISEPAIQYSSGPVNETILPGVETDALNDMNQSDYMTVSEYFDKVRKALDLRYENLQSNNQ